MTRMRSSSDTTLRLSSSPIPPTATSFFRLGQNAYVFCHIILTEPPEEVVGPPAKSMLQRNQTTHGGESCTQVNPLTDIQGGFLVQCFVDKTRTLLWSLRRRSGFCILMSRCYRVLTFITVTFLEKEQPKLDPKLYPTMRLLITSGLVIPQLRPKYRSAPMYCLHIDLIWEANLEMRN